MTMARTRRRTMARAGRVSMARAEGESALGEERDIMFLSRQRYGYFIDSSRMKSELIIIKAKKRSFADENPNVDRSPAVRGRRDDSLLTITLMRNGQPFVSTYGREVDWNDASHINRLNKYRQQVFRYV
jgi:hypothetical protein